ncbi:restriction endonuclease subunit S [Aeromonas caviae]|uniref:restriction endonuclease subunit S n=2 Tax=Aeromonadaceae TaxID=84642 RepID=UPI0024CD6AAA|nr:restriction endonuclease subunit S [Aeromonas caviae]
MVKLKNCCTIVGGATPRRDEKSFWDSPDIPWVTPKDISNLKNKVIHDAPEYISQLGFDKSATFMLPEGSVLLTSRAPIGNLAVTGKPMCTNQGFKSLVPNPDVDCTYLYYCMLANIEKLQALGNGATFKEVSKKVVEDFEIPLPPLDEQKRIAAILDKADAIRQKRQQAIALADDFLRSVFLDMFGDPVTNPKGCKLLPMTEVFHIKTGKLNSNAEVKSGVYPFFTCAKEVYRIDHYAFDQEALLLAGNNAQADYDVKHYIGKFNAYQRTYVLSLKNENWSYPFFKFALEFQLSNLKNSSKGSNTKYITMEIMSRTMLPSPSPSEQSEFATYFKQQMDMRNILDKSQQESNALFNSLSQKAFSGQL